MATKTPYELRFDIFTMSYSMLTEKYHSEAEQRQRLGETTPIDFPTLEQVIQQARQINNFISSETGD